MQNYKDLRVWERAHKFTFAVYEATKQFPKEELYGLTLQIRRAASSIPANIAESGGKNTQTDLANYLNVALGSANEAEYFLILSKDLKYLNNESFESLIKNINEIKAMLITKVSSTA